MWRGDVVSKKSSGRRREGAGWGGGRGQNTRGRTTDVRRKRGSTLCDQTAMFRHLVHKASRWKKFNATQVLIPTEERHLRQDWGGVLAEPRDWLMASSATSNSAVRLLHGGGHFLYPSVQVFSPPIQGHHCEICGIEADWATRPRCGRFAWAISWSHMGVRIALVSVPSRRHESAGREGWLAEPRTGDAHEGIWLVGGPPQAVAPTVCLNDLWVFSTVFCSDDCTTLHHRCHGLIARPWFVPLSVEGPIARPCPGYHETSPCSPTSTAGSGSVLTQKYTCFRWERSQQMLQKRILAEAPPLVTCCSHLRKALPEGGRRASGVMYSLSPVLSTLFVAWQTPK